MAASSSSAKIRKRPWFSSAEDRIILHEIYSKRAFCAVGNAINLFGEVAETLNDSNCCQGEVNAKSVRDRFYTMVKKFRTTDKYKRGLSGTDEIVSKEDEILYSMVSAIDDILEEKEAVKSADRVKKEKQKLADQAVKEYAMNRRSSKRPKNDEALEASNYSDSNSFSRFPNIESGGGLVTAAKESSEKTLNDNLAINVDEEPKEPTVKKLKKAKPASDDISDLIQIIKNSDEAYKKEKEEQRKERAIEREFEREEREKDRQSRNEELKILLDGIAKVVRK